MLRRGVSDAAGQQQVLTGLGGGAAGGSVNGANAGTGSRAGLMSHNQMDADQQMHSNSNMSHQVSKEAIS